MDARIREGRGFWLVGGVLIGLGISYFWPHEPIRADQADRTDKFAMLSVPASSGIGGLPSSEAIFVLDFSTGVLQGFYLGSGSAGFTQSFYRNVATDFQLDQKGAALPMFAVVGGQSQITGQGAWGSSVIYVAEMTTGQIVGYAFPFSLQNQQTPPQQMQPIAKASFRRAQPQ